MRKLVSWNLALNIINRPRLSYAVFIWIFYFICVICVYNYRKNNWFQTLEFFID